MALPPGRKPLGNDWFLKFDNSILQHRFPNVTRVEVIDSTGRVYSEWDVKDVSISVQDNERTLKVFMKND